MAMLPPTLRGSFGGEIELMGLSGLEGEDVDGRAGLRGSPSPPWLGVVGDDSLSSSCAKGAVRDHIKSLPYIC